MKIYRESKILWLGVFVAFLSYLQSYPRHIPEWDYHDWIASLMFISVWFLGKLQHSYLDGEPKDNIVSSLNKGN